MLDVYQRTLAANGAAMVPLSLDIHNEIPVGMGCGSSAAVRLAGVTLANHFGKLGWDGERVLDEAALLEGHPDNAAACWLGGLTVATAEDGHVHALKVLPATSWRVLLVMPERPLATTAARAVLPGSYSREDAVFNIQRASLFTAAFAHGRGDLLQHAMQDRLHQPFREEICPLLAQLSPLAGSEGILGVVLSGAGPSVLMLVDRHSAMSEIRLHVANHAKCVELIECGIHTQHATVTAHSADN
jgi:homoserine kinase